MAKHPVQQLRFSERILKPLLRLPRAVRVGISAVFALATALVLTPLVDLIYTEMFFSPETVIVPALISTAAGMVMYLLGWWLLVGAVGEKLEPRGAMLWYLGVGLLIVSLAVALFFNGLSMLDPAGS